MARTLSATELKRLHRAWRRMGVPPLEVLLDDVQQPFNVGTLVRTAAAQRVDQLWLCGATPTPEAAKVARTAMGCDRLVPWRHLDGPAGAIGDLAARDVTLVGLELTGDAVPLHTVDLTTGVCLALGHEDRGLSGAVLDACDVVAFIPQLGRVGSLNVAQAGAMAIYEARRQAWVAAGGAPPGG